MQILQPRAKQIGDYQFNPTDKIGQGFSSQVYKGKHAHKDQLLAAIKTIDMKRNLNPVEKELLGNQVKALRTLSHPNIINLFEIFQTENNLYIITQLCDQNLATYIKEKGSINQVQSLSLLKQIVSGFTILAQFKIVHRDTKPSNILLSGGAAKIADFGFCQFIDSRNPNMPFYNVGSPKYMSPQAYKKSQYSQKSDVWGVGMIFLEMLHGKLPFQGMQYDEMIKSIATGKAYTGLDISGFSKMLLSRMLSIDLQRRVTFKQVIKFLDERPSNLTSASNNPMAPMNRIMLKPEISYRHSLVGIMPATTKAERRMISKQNKGKSEFPSSQCILVQGTIINQPNCFPSAKNRQVQPKQKQNQLRKHQKSYHQTDNYDAVKFKRPISYTQDMNNHHFGTKNPPSPTFTKTPITIKNIFEDKIQQRFEQVVKNTGYIPFKIQQLLKIVSLLHSDARLRINTYKIKLLKLVYNLAYTTLKRKSQGQRRTSAQLSNLQIILKGYMFLESQAVAQEDQYYQHVNSKIGQLPENQVFTYLSFWTSKCLQSYLSDFEKEWKFKDLNQNGQQAKDNFNKIKILFDFYQNLNYRCTQPKMFQCLQSISFQDYKRVVNGVKQAKY